MTLHTASIPAAVLILALLAGPAASQDPKVERRRTALVEVVERARPAVVSIDAYNTTQPDWWGRVFKTSVSGTGVVIYEDGYIVTNNHVITSGKRVAPRIVIRFDRADDDNVYEGTVISRVPEEDLALIKIEGERSFPTIPLSDDDPMLGETVIAIGNALGESHTVSTGIISGLHRELHLPQNALHFRGLIQTDAAINHGNSGGPLLDINGELIGINTAINAAGENIGFAIPVKRVQSVLSNHLLDLSQASSYLGLEVDEERFEVTGIVPGGPAALASFVVGDRLLAIDDKPLEDIQGYRLARLSIQPGEKVVFLVDRSGARQRVLLEAWSPIDGIILDRIGMQVKPIYLGNSFRRYLQIAGIDPEGPAARIGIQAGDVIAAVRAQGYRAAKLDRPRELAYLVSRLDPGTSLQVEVFRDDDGDGSYERNDKYSELYTGTLRIR